MFPYRAPSARRYFHDHLNNFGFTKGIRAGPNQFYTLGFQKGLRASRNDPKLINHLEIDPGLEGDDLVGYETVGALSDVEELKRQQKLMQTFQGPFEDDHKIEVNDDEDILCDNQYVTADTLRSSSRKATIHKIRESPSPEVGVDVGPSPGGSSLDVYENAEYGGIGIENPAYEPVLIHPPDYDENAVYAKVNKESIKNSNPDIVVEETAPDVLASYAIDEELEMSSFKSPSPRSETPEKAPDSTNEVDANDDNGDSKAEEVARTIAMVDEALQGELTDSESVVESPISGQVEASPHRLSSVSQVSEDNGVATIVTFKDVTDVTELESPPSSPVATSQSNREVFVLEPSDDYETLQRTVQSAQLVQGSMQISQGTSVTSSTMQQQIQNVSYQTTTVRRVVHVKQTTHQEEVTESPVI